MSNTHFPAVPDHVLAAVEPGMRNHRLGMLWKDLEFEIDVSGVYEGAEGVLPYKPGVTRRSAAIMAALRGEGPLAVNDYDRAEALRAERFRAFCRQDGIVNGQRTREDGVVEYFAPDAMGYPTCVLTSEDAGAPNT